MSRNLKLLNNKFYCWCKFIVIAFTSSTGCFIKFDRLFVRKFMLAKLFPTFPISIGLYISNPQKF